jgi:ABC-2 type transport system permease protein/oleandomycin transport system permease protein
MSEAIASARWVVADSMVLAKRYLLRYVRVPAFIVFSAIQPVLFVLLFRYVFGGAIHVPNGSYVDFLLPGIIVQTASFTCFGTAIGLADDLKNGLVERFRSLPMSRSAVLLGRLTADTVHSLFSVLLMIAVGYAVGFRIHTNIFAAILLVVVAVAFGLAICTVGAFIGLSIRDPETMQSAGLIWLFPLTFASAAFVPVASMPGWLQAFAKVNPVTVYCNVLRDLTLGGKTAIHLLQAVGWLAAILVVFAPLATRAYKRAV